MSSGAGIRNFLLCFYCFLCASRIRGNETLWIFDGNIDTANHDKNKFCFNALFGLKFNQASFTRINFFLRATENFRSKLESSLNMLAIFMKKSELLVR